MHQSFLLQSVSKLVVLTTIVFVSGCSQTSSLLKLGDKVPTPNKQDPLHEVLGIWQPSEGRGPEGKTRRGCAGQLLFMTRGQKSPVKIDGEVIVRQWDEFSTDDDKPIHTFRFDSVAWNRHFAEGALGPGYSVFIPYMRDNKYEAHCVIQAELKLPNGQSLYSPKSTVVLPGPRRPVAKKPSRSIAQVSHSNRQPEKKSISESLGTLDGKGRLKPVDRDQGVQQASYESEDDETRLAAKKALLMAEFQDTIAELKRQGGRSDASQQEDTAETTEAAPRRFRMSGKQLSASRSDFAE
ncbi:hypothetical protein OAH18_00470 [bacterium]|nr:hypothetical protein [bacterium]